MSDFPNQGFIPALTLYDIYRKYGESWDAAIDAFLDRKLTEEEDLCIQIYGDKMLLMLMQRRIFERGRHATKSLLVVLHDRSIPMSQMESLMDGIRSYTPAYAVARVATQKDLSPPIQLFSIGATPELNIEELKAILAANGNSVVEVTSAAD